MERFIFVYTILETQHLFAKGRQMMKYGTTIAVGTFKQNIDTKKTATTGGAAAAFLIKSILQKGDLKLKNLEIGTLLSCF
jgi:hypothetical protein